MPAGGGDGIITTTTTTGEVGVVSNQTTIDSKRMKSNSSSSTNHPSCPDDNATAATGTTTTTTTTTATTKQNSHAALMAATTATIVESNKPIPTTTSAPTTTTSSSSSSSKRKSMNATPTPGTTSAAMDNHPFARGSVIEVLHGVVEEKNSFWSDDDEDVEEDSDHHDHPQKTNDHRGTTTTTTIPTTTTTSVRLCDIIDRISIGDGKWRYYVHYRDFNRRMDEWIGMDRIVSPPSIGNAKARALKKEEERLKKKQHQQQQQHASFDHTKWMTGGGVSSSSSTSMMGQSRGGAGDHDTALGVTTWNHDWTSGPRASRRRSSVMTPTFLQQQQPQTSTTSTTSIHHTTTSNNSSTTTTNATTGIVTSLSSVSGAVTSSSNTATTSSSTTTATTISSSSATTTAAASVMTTTTTATIIDTATINNNTTTLLSNNNTSSMLEDSETPRRTRLQRRKSHLMSDDHDPIEKMSGGVEPSSSSSFYIPVDGSTTTNNTSNNTTGGRGDAFTSTTTITAAATTTTVATMMGSSSAVLKDTVVVLPPTATLVETAVVGGEHIVATIPAQELDEHEGLDEASLREHEEVTKVKNVNFLELGPHRMETWYFSPLPKELLSEKGFCEVLYCCEFTLSLFRRKSELQRFQARLPTQLRHPPGNEIYRHENLSMFEVDGYQERIYSQNLSYIAKLFLDHKTLYFDVDPFLFYVLCEVDNRGFHIVGYFSKEKYSDVGYNLACILTFPSNQRKGYGRFLIAFSYELSKREEKVGSPEKPMSDLGQQAYKPYWASTIVDFLLYQSDESSLSIMDIAKRTSIMAEDIVFTLNQLGILKIINGVYFIAAERSLLERIAVKYPVKEPRVNPTKLHWTPFLTDVKRDKFSIHSKKPRIEEEEDVAATTTRSSTTAN